LDDGFSFLKHPGEVGMMDGPCHRCVGAIFFRSQYLDSLHAIYIGAGTQEAQLYE